MKLELTMEESALDLLSRAACMLESNDKEEHTTMLKRANHQPIYSPPDSTVAPRRMTQPSHVTPPPLTPPQSYKCPRLAKAGLPNAFDFRSQDDEVRQSTTRKCAGTQTPFSSYFPITSSDLGKIPPLTRMPQESCCNGDPRFVFGVNGHISQSSSSTFHPFNRIPPPSHLCTRKDPDESNVPLNLTMGSTNGLLASEEFNGPNVHTHTESPSSSLTLSSIPSRLSAHSCNEQSVLKLDVRIAAKSSGQASSRKCDSVESVRLLDFAEDGQRSHHADETSDNQNCSGKQPVACTPADQSDVAVTPWRNIGYSTVRPSPAKAIWSLAGNTAPRSNTVKRGSSLQKASVISLECAEGIEEHFQRSLGKDYSKCIDKGVLEIKNSTAQLPMAAGSKFNDAVSANSDQASKVIGDVDDHFAKSLGAAWTRLKNRNNDFDSERIRSDFDPERIRSDFDPERIRSDSVDDHFAKALGDTWLRLKADKGWTEPVRARSSN